MRAPTVQYRSVWTDSTRWDGFPFRDDDIVICTPPKCGTTWTQMICALLIFQSPHFPRALDEMSPWPDAFFRRREEILADLEAQPHRRFMKTHLPLDGLPYDERVTYICVGRDPRDAAISWDNHVSNTNFDVVMAIRSAAVDNDGGDGSMAAEPPLPPPSDSPRERFWNWVDSDDEMIGLRAVFHHLTTFWRVRHEPNLVLLHYDDLKEDLPGKMRELAGRLGITVAEETWPELVQAATFDDMSRHAAELAPEKAIWHNPDRFFHRGTSGQWRDLLDAEDLRRYRARVEELAEPDLATWAHHGPIEP